MSLRQIDVATAVPWLLTLLAIAIGGFQFIREQEQASKAPFLEKQMEIAFEISDALAILATEEDPNTLEAARDDFWRLYWGPLSIVENREIEAWMLEAGGLVPKQPGPMDSGSRKTLTTISYCVAHAIRKLVIDAWRIDLGEVLTLRQHERCDRQLAALRARRMREGGK